MKAEKVVWCILMVNFQLEQLILVGSFGEQNLYRIVDVAIVLKHANLPVFPGRNFKHSQLFRIGGKGKFTIA